jgi:hypothetical protein
MKNHCRKQVLLAFVRGSFIVTFTSTASGGLTHTHAVRAVARNTLKHTKFTEGVLHMTGTVLTSNAVLLQQLYNAHKRQAGHRMP